MSVVEGKEGFGDARLESLDERERAFESLDFLRLDGDARGPKGRAFRAEDEDLPPAMSSQHPRQHGIEQGGRAGGCAHQGRLPRGVRVSRLGPGGAGRPLTRSLRPISRHRRGAAEPQKGPEQTRARILLDLILFAAQRLRASALILRGRAHPVASRVSSETTPMHSATQPIWRDGHSMHPGHPPVWTKGRPVHPATPPVWREPHPVHSATPPVWRDGHPVHSATPPVWRDGHPVHSATPPVWRDGHPMHSATPPVWRDRHPVHPATPPVWRDGHRLHSATPQVWRDGHPVHSATPPVWRAGHRLHLVAPRLGTAHPEVD